MIKRFDDLGDHLLDFPQIAYPAFVSLNRTPQRHRAFEAVPMDFFEQVIRVVVAKIMGGLELKISFDFKKHDASLHHAARNREHVENIGYDENDAGFAANRLSRQHEEQQGNRRDQHNPEVENKDIPFNWHRSND